MLQDEKVKEEKNYCENDRQRKATIQRSAGVHWLRKKAGKSAALHL